MASASPTTPPAPQVYDWEPSNAAIAAQYGIDPASVLRFDLNTPPTVNPVALAVLDGPFETSLSEYPDADYKVIADAAAAYTGVDPSEIIVGAGADEVLDTIAKAFLPTGGRAIIPIPTYAMYAVHTSQRGATADTVLRLPAEQGFRMDLDQVIARLPGADVVWLCCPVNPTGLPETPEDLRALLDAAAALGPAGPVVVVDEAYFEFAPATLVPLRASYPGLIVVRTRVQGVRARGLPGGLRHRPATDHRPARGVSTAQQHHRRVRQGGRRRAVACRRDARACAGDDRASGRGSRASSRRSASSPLPERDQLPAAAHRQLRGGRVADRGAAARRRRAPLLRSVPPAGRAHPGHGAGPGAGRPARGTREGMEGARGMTASTGARTATRARTTSETDIAITVDLDGTGVTDIQTGVGFYDHLLTSFGHHALIDLRIQASGDLHIDEHHTVEDVALVAG